MPADQRDYAAQSRITPERGGGTRDPRPGRDRDLAKDRAAAHGTRQARRRSITVRIEERRVEPGNTTSTGWSALDSLRPWRITPGERPKRRLEVIVADDAGNSAVPDNENRGDDLGWVVVVGVLPRRLLLDDHGLAARHDPPWLEPDLGPLDPLRQESGAAPRAARSADLDGRVGEPDQRPDIATVQRRVPRRDDPRCLGLVRRRWRRPGGIGARLVVLLSRHIGPRSPAPAPGAGSGGHLGGDSG